MKIIYDAAHAFGVTLDQVKVRGEGEQRSDKDLSTTLTADYNSGVTIGAAGDMSMFSFHPTKLFHSCEGGLLVFKDSALQQKLFDLRNFAIHSETECVDVGTNAKMNELQALMGLCCLKNIDELLDYRQKIYNAYVSVIEQSEQSKNQTMRLLPYSANRAYVPVLFKDFETRERVYTDLKGKCNVFARRYFYPLLTDFAPYAYAKGSCPVAEDVARRVLTLPTYYGLDLADVRDIAKNVMEMV